MSFESENEKRRILEQRKNNVLKRNAVNCTDEVFYVGSLDLQDPYSGEHIYVPSKQYLADLESKEKAVSENIPETNEVSLATGDTPSSQASDEELQLANEIYERLMAEAAADEFAKQAEIEALRQQVEETEEAYNAATGSYSGLYGKKPMNQDEADALANILNTNSSYSKSIDDLIRENQ